MALAQYNTMLEYGNNILEFWNYDSEGQPVSFEDSMQLSITRLDNDSITYNQNSTYGPVTGVDGVEVPLAYVKINIHIDNGSVKDIDKVYDYIDPTFEHVYSLKSDTKTYLFGKLKMIKTA